MELSSSGHVGVGGHVGIGVVVRHLTITSKLGFVENPARSRLTNARELAKDAVASGASNGRVR